MPDDNYHRWFDIILRGTEYMREPASIWFERDSELRQLCGDAQSQAKSEGEMDFTREMMLEANQKGLLMQISEKQLNWLCKIADWEPPKRRS